MIVDVDLIVFNCIFSRAVTLNRYYYTQHYRSDFVY